MNFVRFVTATSCYCCYSVCFVWSAAISASMVLPFRNLQARGVHGGKLWFIQLLYSCYYWLSQKKKTPHMDSGKILTISDCLFGKQTIFLYLLHLPAKTPEVLDSQAQGCRGWPVLPLACTPEPEVAVVEQDTGSQANWDEGLCGFGFPWVLYDTPKPS